MSLPAGKAFVLDSVGPPENSMATFVEIVRYSNSVIELISDNNFDIAAGLTSRSTVYLLFNS